MQRQAILLCVTLFAAAGSLRAQEPACAGILPDSLAAVEPSVHTECTVTSPAERQGGHPTLNFRPADVADATRTGCLRTELGFVVDASGRVEQSSVTLLETNFPEFAEAVLATTGRLRYRPARGVDGAVRQWVTYIREAQVPNRSGPFRVGRVGSMAPAGGPPRLRLESCR